MAPEPAKLSRKDLKFLMSLLDKAEEEADDMIEMGGKRAASLRRRQIMRIRLKLIDLNR